MSVDLLLDWAAAFLEGADSGFTADALAEQLRSQFHGVLENLEVLLALDRRFLRDAEGKWQLAQVDDPEEMSSELFSQAQVARERALRALSDERAVIEVEVASVRGRLRELEETLAQLGYETASNAEPTSSQEGQYSLEYHLQGLPQVSRDLAVETHKAILRLPETSPTFNKYHIAYSTRQRLAMMVTRKRKMVVYIRAGPSFEDPRGWTRDATSRRLGMERMFDLLDAEALGYAMHLIEQSYRFIGERSG